MDSFDQPQIRHLKELDDTQLEAVRVQVRDFGDERFEQVMGILVMRGLPMLERVCRTRGEARGLGRAEIGAAIEDATARLLMALSRPDHQPPVRTTAAELAAECVEAQALPSPRTPRLAPRSPELRVLGELGGAIEEGKIKRNDWRGS